MNHQGMELNELTSRVKIALEKVQYPEVCIRKFVIQWNRLRNYMDRNSETIFT